MNLSVGIIGLPNVGKSTLFNALLKRQAALAANYPFATIEPNVGVVPVPDERLVRLAEITKTEEGMSSLPPIKYAMVEFVDIAGLVKGASEGAGLGNKFLSHIREVRIISHVVRAFEDPNVTREGSVGVKEDYETIRTELALSDLQLISNIKNKIEKTHTKYQTELLNRIEKSLNQGTKFDSSHLAKEEGEFVRSLNLLTSKPEVIVLNVEEKDYTKEKIQEIIEKYQKILHFVQNEKIVVISAKIEDELSALDENEQRQYLADLGLEESGLERLIRLAYKELGLIAFLTAGEKEVRAWTILKGTSAQNAAGEIHTDFIKNFIKAEVVSFEEFVANNGPASPDERASRGGWKSARASGKARMEGRDYVVSDGDVIEFKIGR